MLQSAKKHFKTLKLEDSNQRVEFIEYRNVAPLYCDEEMRICVKEKRRTDTGSVWDVWIEGPTGGMAVKALVRTVRMPPLRKVAPPSKLPPVPYLYSTGSSPLTAGIRVRSAVAVRGRPLTYLYTRGSPLMAWIQNQREPTATKSPPEPRPVKDPYKDPSHGPVRRYSRRWLANRACRGMRYLYFSHLSPLFNTNTVAREPSSEQDEGGKTDSTKAPARSKRDRTSGTSEFPASRTPTLAQRQRAALLASLTPSNAEAPPAPRAQRVTRKVESTAPSTPPSSDADTETNASTSAEPSAEDADAEPYAEPDTGPEAQAAHADALSLAYAEAVADAEKEPAARKFKRGNKKYLTVRKMQQTVIRKTDISLKDTAVKRYNAGRRNVFPPVKGPVEGGGGE